MKNKIKAHFSYKPGSVLALVVIAIVILAALGIGILTVAYGVRHRALAIKNETSAMLAAEAGYEKAIFWMGQQSDLLYVMKTGGVHSDSINFGASNSKCDYTIQFYTFVGSRPVYKVISNGQCGVFKRAVEVLTLQEIGGWSMGMCRVPSSTSATAPVYFADGEIVDMPLHINDLKDSPDERDIYISGSPRFLRKVSMGEDRRTSGGADKYAGVINLFDSGIYFNQPKSKIVDELTVQSKVDGFRGNTNPAYTFTPVANAPVTKPLPAVQLEFFVEGGVGKVRITNNCTVRGYQRTVGDTWDYKIVPGSGATQYEKYDVYAYHVKPNAELPVTAIIGGDLYVTQKIGTAESEPGGQIFVNGNVVIGSKDYNQMVVKGTLTVVATGNIWIADSIVVDGARTGDLPAANNPNVLGLIAQGVIKVVDPGFSSELDGGRPDEPAGFSYVPVCNWDGTDDWDRHLPDPTIVEAAVTVGGGGWGAEDVRRGSGGRKEASGIQDYLILRGAITEVVRGVVGLVGSDGYIKRYYVDERLLTGILPGDIWLTGKYIPAPAGWKDYRLTN